MNKYKNQKIFGFDSKKEARRYRDLSLLENEKYISEVKRQVKYVLIPKQDGERECAYIADFEYTENGQKVVEDVKSPATRKLPAYVIKRKLMLWVHGIRIKEV